MKDERRQLDPHLKTGANKNSGASAPMKMQEGLPAVLQSFQQGLLVMINNRIEMARLLSEHVLSASDMRADDFTIMATEGNRPQNILTGMVALKVRTGQPRLHPQRAASSLLPRQW